ncbi:hypothetical protein P7K49_013509, partial [Saguinus oedipus]
QQLNSNQRDALTIIHTIRADHMRHLLAAGGDGKADARQGGLMGTACSDQSPHLTAEHSETLLPPPDAVRE